MPARVGNPTRRRMWATEWPFTILQRSNGSHDGVRIHPDPSWRPGRLSLPKTPSLLVPSNLRRFWSTTGSRGRPERRALASGPGFVLRVLPRIEAASVAGSEPADRAGGPVASKGRGDRHSAGWWPPSSVYACGVTSEIGFRGFYASVSPGRSAAPNRSSWTPWQVTTIMRSARPGPDGRTWPDAHHGLSHLGGMEFSGGTGRRRGTITWPSGRIRSTVAAGADLAARSFGRS